MVSECDHSIVQNTDFIIIFFLIQHHWTSILHLRNLICLWLLICVPAILGHSWALFQEAPWTGEWHRHGWQQLVHCLVAFPLESFAGFCWPVQHLAGPLHPYVCSVPGWLYIQTPCFQCQRQGGRKKENIQIPFWKKDLQFLCFQSSQLSNLGFWDPNCTFWILCALCSLGKCMFLPTCDIFKTTAVSLRNG